MKMSEGHNNKSQEHHASSHTSGGTDGNSCWEINGKITEAKIAHRPHMTDRWIIKDTKDPKSQWKHARLKEDTKENLKCICEMK